MFRLTRLSLANRALISLITIMVAGVGLFSMVNLKQELIPSIEFPQATILTVAPGASPEVVDEQISLPISKAAQGIPGVEQVVADSSGSMSIVSVSYKFGTDSDKFTSSLDRALATLKSTLPEDASPEILSANVADLPIMFITASSDAPIADLSANLTQIALPELESLGGVGAVSVSGAESQRITITPDQQKLATAGLSSADINDLLQANGMTLPVGTLTEDGEMLSVQSGTPLSSLEDLESLPLASQTEPGSVLTLGSVATVEVITEDKTSITRTNGQESLSLSVTAGADADLVAVSHDIDELLERLPAELGNNTELTVLFSQAEFIEESVSDLATEGLLGLGFAVLVILVFLLSVRSTLVTAISIPLSILVTFVGLYVGGYSLNMLTLGALTIAIGRVVDDSIVVIENIKRHLSYGGQKKDAILTGVREVAGAITASTLTTVAVFIPIALVSGTVGELFRPFAVTVAIAMLSSLLVALTIVPVLSYWFLGKSADVANPDEARAAAEEKEHTGPLQRSYKPVLRSTQRHPVITVVASVLLFGLTVGIVPFLKVDFLGDTGQNMLMVSQEFEAGTDLDEISAGATDVEEALQSVDGVETVMMLAGSGDDGLGALLGGSGGTASFIVMTDSKTDQVLLKDRVRSTLDDLDTPGEVSLPDMGMGFDSTVDVVVTATDEDALAEAAQTVYDAVVGTEQSTEVVSDLSVDQPILEITVDRSKALALGLSEMQVTGIVAGTLSPQSIGELRVSGSDLKIFVDNGQVPATTAELEQLPLPTAAGMTPLAEIAAIERVEVPSTITRQDAELVATIAVTPAEGELGQVTQNVQDRLDALNLPAGVEAKVGGLAELQGDSFKQLGLAMVIAIAIVYLIMVATFKSLVQPLILLVSVPFAATGALLLLLLTGTPLGISALIGMLMLIGIVVTNAIVLIDLVNQYRLQGQTVPDAVFNGARQRLRPIVMTALATIFALIPMAFGVTGSSGFISQDLAIVVIGGLVSSTALTLVLVPVLYNLIEGRSERRTSKSAV